VAKGGGFLLLYHAKGLPSVRKVLAGAGIYCCWKG